MYIFFGEIANVVSTLNQQPITIRLVEMEESKSVS